jgi:hypothetical protein
MAHPKSNQFVVDLGDVRLPDQVSDKIEQAIRRAALGVIAGIDIDGDIGIKLPGDLRGIYLDISRLRFR